MTVSVIFSVRDVVSNTYGTPFYSQSEATAIRAVRTEVNSGQATVIAGSPGDFELYSLGTFDDESGIVSPSPRPVFILRCDSLSAAASISVAN